jgi:CRISPR/Cas system CSM-associated protein Csm3 (group 7 of RAMP superfamily)
METERINYKITFLSDWHAGSGLGSGADSDAVVIKDADNLPYLPGKTIKGLIKDSLLDIKEVQPEMVSKDFIDKYFGSEIKDEKEKVLKTIPGSLFFSNAALPIAERNESMGAVSQFLYRNIASTAIDKTSGVAQQSSLRTMEVCIPIIIEGYIAGLDKDALPTLEMGLKMLRHLGSNRNRGLGRCTIELKN